MRIHSEAVLVTWEDVDWKRKEIIMRGNPDTGTKNSQIRRWLGHKDGGALAMKTAGTPATSTARKWRGR
jgi:hypothetical protein